MTFKASFSKVLSYLAKCDPSLYYSPYPIEDDSENKTNTHNDKL